MAKTCPQCGDGAVRGSKLHASDGLLRMLFYSARRCRACRYRFWQINLTKPLLLLGLVGFALFLGWWIPTDDVATVISAHSGANYKQIAQRAERGDHEAQLQMGLRYADGGGVIKNDKEAARWWEKAARGGKTEAQYRYGLALLEGRGVVQDYKAAFYWIEQPAKRGHSEAQFTLGELHRYGTGTPVDKAQAYLWFNLAAAQGVEKAAKARDSLVWQLKPEQISAMQEAASHLNQGQKPVTESATATESVTVEAQATPAAPTP